MSFVTLIIPKILFSLFKCVTFTCNRVVLHCCISTFTSTKEYTGSLFFDQLWHWLSFSFRAILILIWLFFLSLWRHGCMLRSKQEPITFVQYEADGRMAVVKAMGACVRSEGEKFAVVFSFSTSPSWPSPDHRSSPLDDTETSSPRKETPCFPKGRQSKVHYSSCVFVCTCFFFRETEERRELCQ